MLRIVSLINNTTIDNVLNSGVLINSIDYINDKLLIDNFVLSNNNNIIKSKNISLDKIKSLNISEIDSSFILSRSSNFILESYNETAILDDENYTIRSENSPINPEICRIVGISRNTCQCPNCGDKLELLELSEKSKTAVRSAIIEIATKKDMKNFQCLQNFSDWLSDQEEFTYFVDGANVAYSHQNYINGKFSYKQIQLVVNKLKEKGKRILVLLPSCYYQKYIPNSVQRKIRNMMTNEDEAFLLELQQQNMLYLVPNGADDDWYWMYATITEGRKTPAYVLTNDQMKDHKIAFMEPRPFSRWRMNHIMNFHLSKGIEDDIGNTTVEFLEPGNFSYEIQLSKQSKRWHFPSINRGAWLCIDTKYSSNITTNQNSSANILSNQKNSIFVG